MMKPNEICESCTFFKPPYIDGIRQGECHRYPRTHYGCPPTDRDDWCGEWRGESEPKPLNVRGTFLTGNPHLDAMVAKAQAIYNAMSPEEKAAHDQAQRESFIRAMMPTVDPRLD